MSKAKYLFCVTKLGSIGYIHVVPVDYWLKNHCKYPSYIPDSNTASRIEELGYYETKENEFEFDTDKTDIKTVVNDINNLDGFEYSKEFEKYIVSLN